MLLGRIQQGAAGVGSAGGLGSRPCRLCCSQEAQTAHVTRTCTASFRTSLSLALTILPWSQCFEMVRLPHPFPACWGITALWSFFNSLSLRVPPQMLTNASQLPLWQMRDSGRLANLREGCFMPEDIIMGQRALAVVQQAIALFAIPWRCKESLEAAGVQCCKVMSPSVLR